jgi:hypothetical protein
MVALPPLVWYSLGLLQALVAASPVPHPAEPHYFKTNPITRRNLSIATLQNELGPRLSPGTLIFGPDSSDWANATDRWNEYAVPEIQVVVVPAQESDVSKIVSAVADCQEL